MIDIEEKRWLISKTQELLNLIRDEYQLAIEDSKDDTREKVEALEKLRNIGLSSIGFIAAAILTLGAMMIIKSNILEYFLASIGIAVAFYIGMNFLTMMAAAPLYGITKAYYNAAQKVDHARGFVTAAALHVGDHTIDQLKALSDYVVVLSFCNEPLMISAYQDAEKSTLLPEFKPDFKEQITKHKANFELGFKIYKQRETMFVQFYPIFGQLPIYVELIMKNYESNGYDFGKWVQLQTPTSTV